MRAQKGVGAQLKYKSPLIHRLIILSSDLPFHNRQLFLGHARQHLARGSVRLILFASRFASLRADGKYPG